MATKIPSTLSVLAALIRADLTTLIRNRRAALLTLLVPVIILASWKGMIPKVGVSFPLTTAISMGVIAVGLIGYTIAIARDRDKRVFQRLRLTPVPSWTIMFSRLTVQMMLIATLTFIIFLVARFYDGIYLSGEGYLLTFISALITGALYLSLGQIIAGLIKNPETVNAATRLIYFVFVMVGIVGQMGGLGNTLKKWVSWSPYGAGQLLLTGSLTPEKWTSEVTCAFACTVGYILLFAIIGIQRFKWGSR